MKEYLLKKIVKFSWILPFTFFFLLVIENLVSQTSFNQNIQNPVIYYNGAIFTLEKDNSNKEIIEQALRTENGKITHIGTNTNILKLKSTKTTLIDLNGKSVFPAFVSMDVDEELIMNEIFLQMKKLKKDGYWKTSNEKLNLFLDAFRTLTIKQAKLDNVDKPVLSLIKGDALSISIAAASIIAKVTRDNIMLELDKEYPMYDLKNNKGYGTKTHLLALEKYGITKHHRMSYAPVFEASQPRLDI